MIPLRATMLIDAPVEQVCAILRERGMGVSAIASVWKVPAAAPPPHRPKAARHPAAN